MAATIEDRARSYAYGFCLYGSASEKVVAYEAGAKEQRQIDIERACQWWREALQCGINPCNGNERIEEFKQFMEQ